MGQIRGHGVAWYGALALLMVAGCDETNTTIIEAGGPGGGEGGRGGDWRLGHNGIRTDLQ